MSHIYALKKVCFVLCLLFFATNVNSQNLVHYWNFNDSSSITAITTPSQSLITGASIVAVAGGVSEINLSGTGQDFDLNNINARNGDLPGTHLRFNDPIGGALVFSLPTTGFEDIVVKFATRRSGSGAGTQLWSYSTDGTTFNAFATIAPVSGPPTLATLDFSALSLVNNNPLFKIKVEFEAGSGGTVGNNRFDNFTLDASEIPVETLIHYWNFNNNASVADITTVTQSLVTGAQIEAVPGGISEINLGGTGQNFDVLNLNAQNGDVAGTHLRFNDPIGGALTFALPTTGFENVKVRFATRRSGSGAGNQLWAYSIDGTTFVPFSTIMPNNGDPLLEVLDFSDIEAVNNNPNFILKVTFEAGAGGTVGNNRFDNFTAHGNIIGGGDTFPPVVSILPTNQTVNVAESVNPTISFSEPIRLVNNDAVTIDNVASLVELKLDNESGANVPFTATYADDIITITPASPLLNNQNYYVALLPNVVEDFSDNAISSSVSSTFTTIAMQTVLSTGDLAFVAYRMNATATEDEIAFITFVDIDPGTFINFTDSKYTSNPQPQCSNGIVWTVGENECVPAGSVITIQTSELLASKGTVTGSGFGLSSNGDQVIVYTGTAATPNYLTALSSNGWSTDNIACGGSISLLPAGLVDGVSSLNTSTAPGNVSGNAVNAYYNGVQSGTPAMLKAAILNPANWIAVAEGTVAQQWPQWNFPSSLQVVNAVVLNNTSIQVTFNSNISAASASNLANYTGLPGLASVSVDNNIATLTYSIAFTSTTPYSLVIENIENSIGEPMSCPYTFNFSFNTSISFGSNFITVNENAGNLVIELALASPAGSSVDLVVKGAPFSTANSSDFTLATQTLNFTGSSTLTQTITIPIIDDTLEEQQAEYFVLSLENATGLSITGDSLATIYIIDNDHQAPVATEQIELDYIGSFDPSGSNSSTCEIVVHDPVSQRLFTTSAIAGFLDIINFSDPTNPQLISSVDMNSYGGVTSVAVKNGIVAVASPNTNETLNGSVVFFNTDGVFQKQVTVGALPDMIVFSPDGNKVMTANEGQPNTDYSIDPEGSVSVIDISAGIPTLTQSNVTTLLFTSFNAQEAALITSGVRKLKLTSTLSQDLEPEFITINSDSQKAWVSLQENNAIAEISLVSPSVTDIWALGTKDMSLPGNGFDASDNNNEILIANWPVNSFLIPDAISSFSVGGTTYIVTANEGDEKEYTGFEERAAVGSSDYQLDTTVFPNADILKKSHNLGRFRATNLNGDTDNDGLFEEIYSVGARSFSIFNATTKQIVFDSGDDFEMITAALNPSIFNADHEENTPKVRSRAKGPEPEGVTVATIANEIFAFVSMERVGGVMVYNVTNPLTPIFVDYKNTRSTSEYDGDHGAEGITYVSAADSPTQKGYILVANEISGTITIFEINDDQLTTPHFSNSNPATFVLFPNPSKNGQVFFNRTASIEVFDFTGKRVLSAENVQSINTSSMPTGLYFVKTNEGIVKKLIIE